ncbi:hypothetical protein CDD82_5305 [Ophiocordyceps australis]|uniref:Uncharacterized protein n=1 Tax=Ophiocordyceps australis TaxID=1399860 RepID=A0A2C5Z161_9HYPO|nr:hypothetical protein CDD82_5305 [Ophiocordyceps australis]
MVLCLHNPVCGRGRQPCFHLAGMAWDVMGWEDGYGAWERNQSQRQWAERESLISSRLPAVAAAHCLLSPVSLSQPAAGWGGQPCRFLYSVHGEGDKRWAQCKEALDSKETSRVQAPTPLLLQARPPDKPVPAGQAGWHSFLLGPCTYSGSRTASNVSSVPGNPYSVQAHARAGKVLPRRVAYTSPRAVAGQHPTATRAGIPPGQFQSSPVGRSPSRCRAHDPPKFPAQSLSLTLVLIILVLVLVLVCPSPRLASPSRLHFSPTRSPPSFFLTIAYQFLPPIA